MLKFIASTFVLICGLLVSAPAFAQAAVEQSGGVVPFDFSSWYSNGVVGDAGNKNAPFADALGLFNGANCPFGISSQTYPGQTTTQESLFSICVSKTQASINVTGTNGNPAPPFCITVNGICYPFPGTGNGNVVGPPSSTVGDLACFNNTQGTLLSDCGLSPAQLAQKCVRTIASGASDTATTADCTIQWNSATASAKTETLYACNVSNKADLLIVKDTAGTAAANNITLTAVGGNTIDGSSTAVIAANKGSFQIQCDGTGNWMME